MNLNLKLNVLNAHYFVSHVFHSKFALPVFKINFYKIRNVLINVKMECMDLQEFVSVVPIFVLFAHLTGLASNVFLVCG